MVERNIFKTFLACLDSKHALVWIFCIPDTPEMSLLRLILSRKNRCTLEHSSKAQQQKRAWPITAYWGGPIASGSFRSACREVLAAGGTTMSDFGKKCIAQVSLLGHLESKLYRFTKCRWKKSSFCSLARGQYFFAHLFPSTVQTCCIPSGRRRTCLFLDSSGKNRHVKL